MDMREAADRLLAATEARRVELGKKWKQVYQDAGLTHQTLNRWRHGHPVDPLTERALERALLWGPGAREAIATGRQPRPLDEATPRNTPEPAPPLLSPNEEALRVVVTAAARELQVKPAGFDEITRRVRQDLEVAQSPEAATEPPHGGDSPIAPRTGRTDLSDLVRERRLTVGLSLEDVAARAVDPASGEHVIDAAWLDRLERAALDPAEYPEYPQLDALVDVLQLDPRLVQEAAGVQFLDVHTIWSEDGQVRGLSLGELTDPQDIAKAQELMRLYRKAPRRNG
jgi:hypothetical protein